MSTIIVGQATVGTMHPPKVVVAVGTSVTVSSPSPPTTPVNV